LTQNTESSSRRDHFPEQYDGQTGQPEFSAVWAYIPYLIAARGADHEAIASGIDHLARDGAHTRSEQRVALLVEHLAAVGFEDTHVADQHGGSLLHRRPVA